MNTEQLREVLGGGPVERIGLRGTILFELYDKNGDRKERREVKNLVVNAGLTKAAKFFAGTDTPAVDYIAIGTGATAAANGDTALQTEVARSQGTKSTVTTTVTDDTYQVQVTFAAGTGTGAITEAGLLDAASTGDLLCRQVFSAVNKGAGDTLQVTWKIQMQRV
ncbi:MAG: hypothetical protein ACKVRP_14590 [Bacteroidota bacterium]